ncbi:hypothetical protein PENSPDRAFT_371988 [Peniophora sp. CONT]|nr:hypothetical protein PENSPDRAFT_371988 [Peniophora sp. CONT]
MDTAALKKLLADKPIPELLPALASDVASHSLLPVIDAELARRAQQLQDLQTFRNGIASPVMRLPLEVISEILLYLALQSEDTAYSLWWRKHTLVCRRWREAALKTPRLWSFADFTVGFRSHSVLELNRGRAQDYPLSVKFAVRPGNKRYWAAGKPLFWDSRRLRTLDLDILPKQAQTFLDRILPDPHPSLEALKVTSRFLDMTGKDRAPVPDDLAIARLSDEFLLDMTPELRRLFLVDISYSGLLSAT